MASKKNAFLVKNGWMDGWMGGWAVEHTLEKGPSKPYLDVLEKAGIGYKTTPQIHIKDRS